MGSDNANCGGCGITCAYQCNKGVCGPATLTLPGFNSVGPIAIDDTNIYFLGVNTSDASEVDYCPLSGCKTSTVLATATNFVETVPVGSLALSATNVYFPDNSDHEILDCAKPPGGCSGTPATYSASGDSDQSVLVADSTNLYWANDEFHDIFDCSLGASCAVATSLATPSAANFPLGIAVSGTTVFYASDDFSTGMTIYSVAASGGASTAICTAAASNSLGQMIVAGGFVYFSDALTTIYSCATSATGAAATTFTSATRPLGIASDGTSLYWVDGSASGSIDSCALGDTCAAATVVVAGLTGLQGIAVNATTIFWTSVADFVPQVSYFKK
jgi:hypothetical protein